MPVSRLVLIGALAAFASATCALMNLVTMALAVRFHVQRLHDFGGLVDVDDAGELLLVVSMIIDAGFYAFLVPVAVALAGASSRLRTVRLACGIAYGVIGSAGALALAFAWPELFARFDAGGADAARAAQEFSSLTNAVYRVVWNLVCATVGSAWWIATARALWSARPWLARVAIVLGAVSALKALAFFAPAAATGAAGSMGAVAATLLLDVYLTLLPLFALTAGASLLATWRSPSSSPQHAAHVRA